MPKPNRKKSFRKKRPKVEIKFDNEERRDFLTGFQRRKADRKQKAKLELKQKLREEMILMRQKQREKMKEMVENARSVPEVEHLINEEAVTYELPKQVVTITTFDAKEISGSLGLSMGNNSKEDNQKTNMKTKKKTKKTKH